jgi:hypothetical protein
MKCRIMATLPGKSTVSITDQGSAEKITMVTPTPANSQDEPGDRLFLPWQIGRSG